MFRMSKNLPRISEVKWSGSVMSDSLQPHELQHTRPPCPSPTPGFHSDSGSLSQWCHPAISSSVVPFSYPLSIIKGNNAVFSSHVWMWELDYKESWAPRNWCFWTVVLEKALESRLDCKEIQPVHPKGDQSWILIGRNDAKAETPVLWPPDAKSWFIWKDSDAGKDWGQEEKGTTEGEMIGWHHRLNGHEFE